MFVNKELVGAKADLDLLEDKLKKIYDLTLEKSPETYKSLLESKEVKFIFDDRWNYWRYLSKHLKHNALSSKEILNVDKPRRGEITETVRRIKNTTLKNIVDEGETIENYFDSIIYYCKQFYSLVYGGCSLQQYNQMQYDNVTLGTQQIITSAGNPLTEGKYSGAYESNDPIFDRVIKQQYLNMSYINHYMNVEFVLKTMLLLINRINELVFV